MLEMMFLFTGSCPPYIAQGIRKASICLVLASFDACGLGAIPLLLLLIETAVIPLPGAAVDAIVTSRCGTLITLSLSCEGKTCQLMEWNKNEEVTHIRGGSVF